MDTATCENFRDIGEALDSLNQQQRSKVQFPKGRIFRGGLIEFCNPETIRFPKSVINLKMGPDNLQTELYTKYGAKYFQHAVSNELEKYDTSLKEVKQWLNDVFTTLTTLSEVDFPIMFHCRGGKDRTGVVVACLLTVLGFPEDLVIDEFMLSQEVKRADIENSLKNVTKDIRKYFRQVNFNKLQNVVLGSTQ